MNATFTAPGGRDPIAHISLAIEASRVTRADLLFGGSMLVAAIRDRTFAGVDADGNPFIPYSPVYAKRKAKAVGGGLVNLFGIEHHTHMLNALQVIVDSDKSFGVGIYTNDELELRARVHNEGGRMPRRHWLDANATDQANINTGIGERIDERLKRLM